MNPTLATILWILLTMAIVVATVFFVRLAQQLHRLSTEVELVARNLNEMKPRVDQLLHSADQELVHLRDLTVRVGQVAKNAEAVSNQVVRYALPAMETIGAVSRPLRYLRAGLAGASVAASVFQKIRHRREKKSEDASGDGMVQGGTKSGVGE